MSVEVPNFIPVSVLLKKISQKYTFFRRPAKNERTMVKPFQWAVYLSSFKKGRAEHDISLCFVAVLQSAIEHLSLRTARKFAGVFIEPFARITQT
jgi:hypothetical protein